MEKNIKANKQNKKLNRDAGSKILNFSLQKPRSLQRVSLPSGLLRALSFLKRIIFGNHHIAKEYLKSNQIRKLQIGSRDQVLSGWLNTDLDPWKNIMSMDATKRFPFGDNIFDYIFTEHCIEHFEYQVGLQILHECYRVLKPGGRVRISTPDLRFLFELYSDNKTELQNRYIKWEAHKFIGNSINYTDTFVINNFFRDWGHKFIYDYKTLSRALRSCGFVDVGCYEPGESGDKNLQNIERHSVAIGNEDFNRLESMVVEAMKPN